MTAGPSRYANAVITTTVVGDGRGGERIVRYLRQRVPADPSTVQPLAVHRVGHDDRLDLVTARYLGDPTAFWRVADANTALDPDDLVCADAEGGLLVIPVPGA